MAAASTDSGVRVAPYLRLRDAARAIEFYVRAWGAVEAFRLVEKTTGRIGHAELDIGSTRIMLADEYPEYGIVGPEALGGSTAAMHLQVADAAAVVARAVEAGGTVTRPLADGPFGERGAIVRDPFGHEWMVSQRIEQVSPDEMQRRYDAMLAG